MFAVLRYPYEPNDIQGYPPFIDDLLDLRDAKKHQALQAIGTMVYDLRQHSTNSRYLETMIGYPILELKTRSRGGETGGTRVYLYRADENEFHLCAAETKRGNTPTQRLLERTALIAVAWRRNLEVFPTTRAEKRTRRSV
jgi:hypothetical protein